MTQQRVCGAKVLVTGGFGFLGAWMAHRLLDRGNSITLLDNGDYEGSPAAALGLANHADVVLHRGDIRETETFDALEDTYDYIVHAAGFLGIHKVVEQPLATLDINYLGTQRCLEFAAAQPDLKRIIVFSTSEVYGRHAVDVDETSPAVIDVDSLRWGYAASKLAGEFLAMAYFAERRLPVTIVRPFNVYGPFRRGSNAVTALVERALNGEPLQISGDGGQRRTWCYVTDLTTGLEQALLSSQAVGERFNLGNDRTDMDLLELARLIVEAARSSSLVHITGSAAPDVQKRKPVIDKARRLLGYEPAIDAAEGVAQVVLARRAELLGAEAMGVMT
ncbi:NAD-dependent epimerase/dehydratase family protein [Streptomyces rubiginosohelvolus]|uniref:NAD-dependent epimerase/dehydratase family protein n=1 Tax=Streptomyces rubiginosohelvolus TaxID=67362 RepID=UPI0036BAC22C